MKPWFCTISLLLNVSMSLPAADITVAGSSTVGDVLARVAHVWRDQGNAAVVAITGSGSNSALPALAAGSATFATLSRALSQPEIDAHTAAHGPLTSVIIGYDALAVFVHRDNPLTHISLAQLDAAFGAERRRGLAAIKHWGDLHLSESWNDRWLVLIGPQAQGGTHAMMQELVLQGGPFAAHMTREPVTSSIVQGVGTDPAAIGCASASLLSKRTRMVPLGETREQALLPTSITCNDGTYPLARPLVLCWHTNAVLSPEARAFSLFVMSPQGQEIIANTGCFPLGHTPQIKNHQPASEAK